jgi:hypothetical protein
MFELAKMLFILVAAAVAGYLAGGGYKAASSMTHADSVQLHYDTIWWNRADNAYSVWDSFEHEADCNGSHMVCSVNHPLTEDCITCHTSVTLRLGGELSDTTIIRLDSLTLDGL